MLLIVAPLLLVIAAYIYFTRIYFSREPVREIPAGNTIVSPANGVVVAIKKISKELTGLDIRKGLIGKIRTYTKFLEGKEGIMVSIMLNVQNVHLQRCPISGTIRSIRHNKGKYLNAVRDPEKMKWLENESLETVIMGQYLDVKVIQIAGFVARRCISFVNTNEKVIKGQRLGAIRWGSQVSIIFPVKGQRLKIKVGDIVVDGESVIAEYGL